MPKETLQPLRDIVGSANILIGKEIPDRSETWGTAQPCHAMAFLMPADTAEVAAILECCHAAGQSIVPCGGMTNLVQGALTTSEDLALSFERMNRIEEIDPVANTMTVQAGVTMQAAQECADEAGLYFPVDIGARGECMLGGNVSTNAGGTRVIRYGMIRDSILGLEAVLADGTVVSSMNTLLKNNSGFDLKQLFIGSEGQLGLITRIVFRLQAKPRSHNLALVACDEFPQVVELLTMTRRYLGSALCGFEVMWDNYFHEVVAPVGSLSTPIPPQHRYYVIIEATGTRPGTDDDAFEAAIGEIFEAGLCADGVIAKSDTEREAIWAIRHEVEWVVRDSYIFDVSLPVAHVHEYNETITAGITAAVPRAKVVTFGHLGDNNIHICVLCNERTEEQAAIIEQQIYENLAPYGGAISAEHGIGVEKRDWLPVSRTPAEIELMRTLKRSLDPKNVLNPGKVFPADS